MDKQLEALIRASLEKPQDPETAVALLGALGRAGAHQRAHEYSWEIIDRFPHSESAREEFRAVHSKAMIAVPETSGPVTALWLVQDNCVTQLGYTTTQPNEECGVFPTQHSVYNVRKAAIHVPDSLDPFTEYGFTFVDLLAPTDQPRRHGWMSFEQVGRELDRHTEVHQILDYSPDTTFVILKRPLPLEGRPQFLLNCFNRPHHDARAPDNGRDLGSRVTYAFCKKYERFFFIGKVHELGVLSYEYYGSDELLETEEQVSKDMIELGTNQGIGALVFPHEIRSINPFPDLYDPVSRIIKDKNGKVLLENITSVKGISQYFYERLLERSEK